MSLIGSFVVLTARCMVYSIRDCLSDCVERLSPLLLTKSMTSDSCISFVVMGCDFSASKSNLLESCVDICSEKFIYVKAGPVLSAAISCLCKSVYSILCAGKLNQ